MGIEKAIKLCDYYTAHSDCKMKWMWGEGLFGYALAQLDDYLGEERYRKFLEGYCDYWHENRPKVHSSDTSAPGLITYHMWKKYGIVKALELTDPVIDYMRHEPRVLESLVNHMGHSGYDVWYPKSVWVDSLMMFGVFASVYGSSENDSFFLDMAKNQPILLCKYLEDHKTALWFHSYWVKLKTHYPIARIFWGRGNAWVISAIPKILDNIGDCPEADTLRDILARTSAALLKKQHADGSFSTLLGRIGVYKESSATALIADGWMHSVRKGYLPTTYLEPAYKAYEWVDACVEVITTQALKGQRGTMTGSSPHGQLIDVVRMTKISGPTIPMFIFPWLGYALVPKKSNWSYGMAAYVWASIEHDRL